MTNVQYDAALAEAYSSEGRFEHPIGLMNYETWLEELGEIRGKSILDLACGSGHSSRLLARRGAIVTGVDISPEMIKLAQEEVSRSPLGITYLIGDAATLDLGQQFDIVTPSYLLHYAKSKLELAEFARTVAKHLVRGGMMVALHANDEPIVPLMPNGQHSTEWYEGDTPWQEGSRIVLYLYDLSGHQVCAITFFYWTAATYRAALEEAGLMNATWVKIRMSEAGKQIPNWRELDKFNTSCILTAVKA